MSSDLALYTFAVSHFSEKIRWTLDAAKIPYREIAWTPSFHLIRARIKSGKATTVPIVELGGEVVQDSTAILHWLEGRYGLPGLLPVDGEPRSAVLDIEDRFDTVGTRVIRYSYSVGLKSPAGIQEMWLKKSGAAERFILPILFPLVVPVIRRMYKVQPEAVERAYELIDKELTWLDRIAESGKRYLVGDRLTVADITVASLLAPIAAPAEHPVYGMDSYRSSMKPAADRLGARPGLEWVRDLYRRDRNAGLHA